MNIPKSVNNVDKSVNNVDKSVNNAEHKVESVHRSRLKPDHTTLESNQSRTRKVLNQT